MRIQKVLRAKGRTPVWRLSFYSTTAKGNVRRRFSSKEEALRFFKSQERLQQGGMPAQIAQATSGEKADIVAALEICAEGGFRLLDAVRSFANDKIMREARRPMPDTDRIEGDFLAGKTAQGCRPATLKSYLSAFGSIRLRAKQPLELLTHAELRNLLDAAKVSPVSKNNWRRHVRVFFGWLKRQGFRPDDPSEDLPTYKTARQDPCIFSAQEAERLMRTVEDQGPQFCRAYSLALFSGIRPKGIERLKIDDILLDERLVRVGYEQDKTGNKYFAPIPDNGIRWMHRYATNQILAVPRYWSRRLFAAAKLKSGHDILRHTFASHHLAAHGSADQTAAALNHRGTEMLFRHYRAAVKPADGKQFFHISPSVL